MPNRGTPLSTSFLISGAAYSPVAALRRVQFGVTGGPVPQALLEHEGLQARGVLGQVEADDALPFARFAHQRFQVELAVGGMGDDAVRHALLADDPGQLAGVDARQADQAAPLHPAVEVRLRTPVGRAGGQVAEDGAAGGGLGAPAELLDVFQVHPGVAHVREGEGDDLGHVGRVGQDLLVAGHGGVEADLAHRVPSRADADPLQDGPVRQGQDSGRARHERVGHGLRLLGAG
jgi:hypothetical protein